MKSSEILELVRAGYTKDEIDAMEEAAAPAADPEPDPAPAADPEPDPAPAADPEPDQGDDGAALTPNKNVAEMEAIKAQISEQTKALKRLEDKLLENKINTGAKGSPDASNNIYDVWAEALNK